MFGLVLLSLEDRKWWMGSIPLGPSSSHWWSNLVDFFPRIRLSLGADR